MPYPAFVYNSPVPSWPALAGCRVRVGGVTVTYAEAAAVISLLAASRTSAIAPVLAAAGHPLAGCDYFAAAAPYLEQARKAPKTGRSGAAGRHVTKNAFIDAVSTGLRQAEEHELGTALRAFGTDERYAAAMAAEAVAIRERVHLTAARTQVRHAVRAAVAACAEHAGEFPCALSGACGTGSCRFAPPALRGPGVPAGPGKVPRPPNHASAGNGFGEGPAVAAFLDAHPYRPGAAA